MKILAWLAMVVIALVVLIPPADARRDGGDKERRGCSSDTHQLVVERDEPAFKLCVFPRDGQD